METCPYYKRLARTASCSVDGGTCRPVTIAIHESDPKAAKLDADAERNCVEGFDVDVVNEGGAFVPKISEAPQA